MSALPLVLGAAAESWSVRDLPALNACLNAAATVLLVTGWLAIRARLVRAHVTAMVLATLVSAAFLASYLVYHFEVGSVGYTKQGPIRAVYFTILITHTVLAMVNLPLLILTLVRALRRDYARHRRIARWTLPIWLYVSVTGIVVYWMLYRT